MMLHKLKKAMLQSPIVLAAPMQTRLDKRPFTQTILSAQGFQLDTVQKVAFGCLVIPTAIVLLISLFSANWSLLLITSFMLLPIGLAVWVVKLRSEMVWEVTWYADRVLVKDGRYGPVEQWSEPLTTFSGLTRDQGRTASANRYSSGRVFYGLLLAHPDPNKSILLHASRDPISAEAVAYYEAQLGKMLLNNGR
ncbi:MAG: hypothetical protein KDE56_12250 [Anaerolineales bacterium]|nr:hypothetical protein [Anaerolineales bacterium]